MYYMLKADERYEDLTHAQVVEKLVLAKRAFDAMAGSPYKDAIYSDILELEKHPQRLAPCDCAQTECQDPCN